MAVPGSSTASEGVAIEIEWFTEEEIEVQLAELLSWYRAYYLKPGYAEGERTAGDAERAEVARSTFEAIFGGRLDAADDELLVQEEEDVLNMIMAWVRELNIPSSCRTEVFPDMQGCLEWLMRLTPASISMEMFFVRKIRYVNTNEAARK